MNGDYEIFKISKRKQRDDNNNSICEIKVSTEMIRTGPWNYSKLWNFRCFFWIWNICHVARFARITCSKQCILHSHTHAHTNALPWNYRFNEMLLHRFRFTSCTLCIIQFIVFIYFYDKTIPEYNLHLTWSYSCERTQKCSMYFKTAAAHCTNIKYHQSMKFVVVSPSYLSAESIVCCSR